MDNRAKGIKNLCYSTAGVAVTMAFGFLLPRLFVVSYGSEVNGLLASLNQLLVYLNLFEAGIGTVTLQALYKPVAMGDWDGINGIMAASDRYYKRTGLCYLAGLIVLSICYPLVVDSSLSILTVAGAVFFSGAGNVMIFLLQGKYRFLLQADGKTYITTNLTTLSTVFISLAKIFLIHQKANVVLILAVSFLLQCLQTVYILWYIRSYPRLRLDVLPDYQAVSQKNSALGHEISSLIFRNTDVLILTITRGLQVVSVYSIFTLVTSHLESILTIPWNSISFSMGQTYQIDKKLYTRRLDLAESYLSAVTYAVFAAALFLFLPFIRLYTRGVTDIDYADHWLPPLFVLASLLNLSRVCACSTISFAGHIKKTLPYSILESFINLAVSLIGVYVFGIYGVLLGTIAALTYRTNQMILYANHKLLERSAKKTYGIYAVNSVLFFLLQPLFRSMFDPLALNSYPRLIIAGFSITLPALAIFIGAHTLLFPDCRQLARELFRRFKNKL